MGRTGLPRLYVDDRADIPLSGNQIRFPAKRSRSASENEAVLIFSEDCEPFLLPLITDFVDSRRMLYLPAGHIECAWNLFPAPALVLCPEPSSPFAGVLTNEQLRQPGYPYVRTVRTQFRHYSPHEGCSTDRPTSLISLKALFRP